MQTFMPLATFAESARVLDQKRLGKQRVENMQIMQALLLGKGYVNHPCTDMWAGYEAALMQYQQAICHEWIDIRGFRDTCLDKTYDLYYEHTPMYLQGRPVDIPWWVADDWSLTMYRSKLLQKNPEHYRPIFPQDRDDIVFNWKYYKGE
jgi:hypothetical protein